MIVDAFLQTKSRDVCPNLDTCFASQSTVVHFANDLAIFVNIFRTF